MTNLFPLTIAISLISFASFTWGLYRHFKVSLNMPFSMRALSFTSLIAYIVFLFEGINTAIGTWQIGVTSLLFVSSLLLFWSAVAASKTSGLHVAHSDSVSHQVATSGPYRLFRHPFYISYRLFWVGTAIVGGPISWTFALAFCLWYAILASQEEKGLLQSELGTSYATYLSEGGLFSLGGFRNEASGTQKSFHPSLLARAVASLRTR